MQSESNLGHWPVSACKLGLQGISKTARCTCPATRRHNEHVARQSQPSLQRGENEVLERQTVTPFPAELPGNRSPVEAHGGRASAASLPARARGTNALAMLSVWRQSAMPVNPSNGSDDIGRSRQVTRAPYGSSNELAGFRKHSRRYLPHGPGNLCPTSRQARSAIAWKSTMRRESRNR